MFQSVRPNSQLYILHKGENPRLDVGYVTNQPVVRPKYQIPPSINQAQEMVVDLTVKVNEQSLNFAGIPANADTADSFSNGESIIISTSRDAMNSEILNLKQKSLDIINSVEAHKAIIIKLDNLLKDLNPEYAEKEAQRQEIGILKDQMKSMSENMQQLMDMNRQLMERIQRQN